MIKRVIFAIVALAGWMAVQGQTPVAAPDTISSDALAAFLLKHPGAQAVPANTPGAIVVRLFKVTFYEIRESDNDTRDAYNVLHQTAQFLQEFRNAQVNIVGYADRGTGNYQLNQMYASRRAAQFCDDLIHRYGVDPLRLTSSFQGDLVQPFRENDLNRCVIISGYGYLSLTPGATPPPPPPTASELAEAQRQQFQQERTQLYALERQRYAKDPSRIDTLVISHQDTLWLGQQHDTLWLETPDTLLEERPFRCNRKHRRYNWFITLEGGPSIFQGDHNVDAVWKDRIYPAFNFSMGKWICPAIGIRAAVDLDMVHSYYNANAAAPNPLAYRDGVFWYGEFVHGASPDAPYEQAPWLYRMRYNAWNFHGDLLLNLSSFMWHPYNRRFWNLIPYVGLGCIVNWDNGSHDWFNYGLCWNLGVLNSFRINEHLDLNIDIRVKKFPDDFNCFRQGHPRDGITNVMIGATWHFTKRGF